jgi:hypothetical protein
MTGWIVPRAELTSTHEERMLGLMQAHFCGISPQQFRHDLDEKNWAILITDEAGRLHGFSMLLFYATAFEGRQLNVVYSGDTIVAAGGRTDPALARTWIEAVNRLRDQAGAKTVYWLLLTSGFRTYRFLPVFWRAFWPRHDAPTPPGMQRLLRGLARERFGEGFKPDAGIVRFPKPQRLRDDLLEIPTGRLADPHVAFFASRNPGFRAGDELVCLCELSEANLTAAGRRMLCRSRRCNAP